MMDFLTLSFHMSLSLSSLSLSNSLPSPVPRALVPRALLDIYTYIYICTYTHRYIDLLRASAVAVVSRVAPGVQIDQFSARVRPWRRGGPPKAREPRTTLLEARTRKFRLERAPATGPKKAPRLPQEDPEWAALRLILYFEKMGFLKFLFSPKMRLQDLGLGQYPIAVLAQAGCHRRPPFLAPSKPLVRSAAQGQAAAWRTTRRRRARCAALRRFPALT